LTVYDGSGNAYDSTFTTTVKIYDFIATQISFSDYKSLIYDIPVGKLIDPLTINTYFSWQSYQALSATGYTINLYASGALGDYNYVAREQNDKWSHLRCLSRFYVLTTINGFKDYITTENIQPVVTPIYVNIQNNQLQLCQETDPGSVLAGVTGSCQFWYTDDKPGNLLTESSPVIIFASVDNAKFKDAFTQRTNAYDYISYPPYGYQNINPAVFSSIKTRYNPADHLSITTTGIDGEGAPVDHVFDIPHTSWQNTEIPYVIKFKDDQDFTTKNYPPLSSSITVNSPIYNNPQPYYDIQTSIVYNNGIDSVPLDGVTFYEDFAASAPQAIGAFYKGYFVSTQSTENCYLTASVNIIDPPYFRKDAIVNWIAIPQYYSAIRFFREELINGYTNTTTITFPKNTFNISTNNVYAITVAPSGTSADSDYRTWFADPVSDQLLQYDIYGNLLTTYQLSAMSTLVNNQTSIVDYRYISTTTDDLTAASPNDIALDGKNNIWVSLFDSGKVIKIDTASGNVTTVATPDITNTFLTSSDYNSESGFAGENLCLPSSIDTDVNNNLWVAYTHPEYSAIVKYQGENNFTTTATILTSIIFPTGTSPEQIQVDRNNNIWITAINHNSQGVGFSNRNDFLYKFDINGSLIPGYPLSGFQQIGNLTIDGNQNAWVIQSAETLTKVDGITNQTTNYVAGLGTNTTNYICSIGGITCDTSNNVWVINNFDSNLYVFDASLPSTGVFNPKYTIPLNYPTTKLPTVTAYDSVPIPFGSGGQNLFLYSTDLTNSSQWNSIATTTVPATITDPIGTQTAFLNTVTTDYDYGFHWLAGTATSFQSNSAYYTYSVYAKRYNTDWISLNIKDSNNNGGYLRANLKDGSLGSSGLFVTAFFTAIPATAVSVSNIGNDWYRFSLTTPMSGNTLQTWTNILTADPGIGQSDTAASVQDGQTGAYFWGRQFEVGTTMNEYVPTTTTQILTSYTIPSTPFTPIAPSDGLKEFQAIGDWNGYSWLNKYAAPVSTIRTITGSSNLFNIYPSTGKYNIAKINENWNASGYYDSLRFQETLLDKQVFFDQFLGVILGGLNAQPYELGKTVYEKIANFVDNNSDVDKVNINELLAFCRELSIEFDQYNIIFPPQLRRLVDLLSIKQSKLWGMQNKYGSNFDPRGTMFPNDTYGINLSSQIDTLTGTFINGIPIVARETFSGNYKIINTNIINDLADEAIVPLSTYTPDWGWGLVAPNISGTQISNYYSFYNYNPVYSDTYYDNVIDWTNPYTTLSPTNSSYNTWSQDGGIIQSLLSYELTKGFKLFTSAAHITYNS
jgi:hypothetical protein